MQDLTLHTAEVLLPMAGRAPLAGGGVVVDAAGVIVEAGPVAGIRASYDSRIDHAVLMPGVLNCHIHLTDARRSIPIPGGAGLNAWARALLSERAAEASAPTSLEEGVAAQLAAMRACGTVAVGEVANNTATLPAIRASGMGCRFIHELIGFRGDRAPAILAAAADSEAACEWDANVAHTLGAHAPFSVAPALMQGIADATAPRGLRFHEHLAEDPAERELYANGGGAWRAMLEHLGVWDPAWEPPGMAPIEYYDTRGWLSDRFVAVHLADASEAELRLLARRGVRAILSPTSNLHITGLLPRLDVIAREGIPFGLGTDGRGSNPSVDVFDEAWTLHQRWSDLRPGMFLSALTSDAADILQMPHLGAIDAGRRPGLLAIDVAPTTDLAALERAVLGAGAAARRLV